jgi:hypothetical protein
MIQTCSHVGSNTRKMGWEVLGCQYPLEPYGFSKMCAGVCRVYLGYSKYPGRGLSGVPQVLA